MISSLPLLAVGFLAAGRASALLQSTGAVRTTRSSALRAAWSNGQAVREYQDFLMGKNQPTPLTEDIPSAIVIPADGVAGPVATMIESLRAPGAEIQDVIISTDGSPPDEIGGNAEYPIYVALTNPDELGAFLDMAKEEGPWRNRLSDMVFFSGGELPRSAPTLSGYPGCVEPYLRGANLARDGTTQVLLNFAMPRANANGRVPSPTDYATKLGPDAMGEEKWTGETAACGKWRQAAALRISCGGVRVRECFYRDWRRAMWERVLHDAVFGLVGSLREDRVSIKEVANYYGEEASDMLWEATSLLRGALAVTITYGFEERIFGLAEAMGESVECEINEELFRRCNGVFCNYKLADDTEVARSGLEKGMRMHSEYIAFARTKRSLIGEKMGGRVILNLGKEAEDAANSPMLQGNLRADGVI
eukprot:CAMPEP_0194272246 /NCGR_PEP_ID=MMETSP0169-20130528/5854_1 /TAXON_ID=218684 /ORGANISM="Corethron pennatum, Strain L29A3" /LENGTH=419 /DNA_ID=CAMNT_0039014857 /DNA_START=36 /DNA_END=1295 /DNA_ORIENTATION=-